MLTPARLRSDDVEKRDERGEFPRLNASHTGLIIICQPLQNHLELLYYCILDNTSKPLQSHRLNALLAKTNLFYLLSTKC